MIYQTVNCFPTSSPFIVRTEARPTLVKRGSGVLHTIKRSIKSCRKPELEPDEEVIVCEVEGVKHKKVAIILLYRSPSSDLACFSRTIENMLVKASKQYERICMLGDFNIPSVNWKSELYSSNITSQSMFCDVINQFSFQQLNTVASNVKGNMLDLVFTNAPEMFSNIAKCPVELSRDHIVLIFSVLIPNHSSEKGNSREVFNYKAADWAGLRQALDETDLCELIWHDSDIDHAWEVWLSWVAGIVNDKVPKVTIKGQSGPPWIDSEVRHLHKVKHTAWCRANRSNKSRDWLSFKKYRNKLKNNIKAKHKAFMAGIGQAVNHNPKRFWSYIKSKTKQKNIPQTVKLNSVTSSDNNEKCNMFNAHFYSSFSPCLKTDDELPHINVKYDNDLSAVNFSTQEANTLLNKLDVHKAYGTDNLSPHILKQCASHLSPSLAILFTLSMKTGKVPSQWKASNVVPPI